MQIQAQLRGQRHGGGPVNTHPPPPAQGPAECGCSPGQGLIAPSAPFPPILSGLGNSMSRQFNFPSWPKKKKKNPSFKVTVCQSQVTPPFPLLCPSSWRRSSLFLVSVTNIKQIRSRSWRTGSILCCSPRCSQVWPPRGRLSLALPYFSPS